MASNAELRRLAEAATTDNRADQVIFDAAASPDRILALLDQIEALEAALESVMNVGDLPAVEVARAALEASDGE